MTLSTPTRISIVSVQTGDEVTWVELTEAGGLTFSPRDMGVGEAVLRQTMADRQLTTPEAMRWLARNGWSNAALMVDLGAQTAPPS